MGVVDPPSHQPEIDPQLPLRGALDEELRDPLSEFAPEPAVRRERLLQFEPPPRERLIEFDPDWRGPGESDRLAEQAFAAARESSPGRAPKGRWLLATVLLGVGLLAGFAGGVAVVTKYGGNLNQSARSVTPTRVESEIPRQAVPPMPPPVSGQPAAAPATTPASTGTPVTPATTPATNDPERTAETNVPRPEPGPRTMAQRTARERVAAPVPTMTGLYVQSSPAGAEVYVDEKLVSTTPFQLSDIAPGRHIVRIELEGYRPWSMPVAIEPGARAKISAVLER